MKFILNDQRVTNSYGFRVLTSGIGLERFSQNPICLNNHSNHTKDVLGTWTDVETSDDLLTATPVFDTQDADGMEVVRKVEKGILKACSIGISFEPEAMKMINGELYLTQCELMEASICAVPANAAAITLYNPRGEMLTETQIKALCLSAVTINPFETINNDTMNIVTTHLQLAEGSTAEAILEAIKGIEAKLTASNQENTKLKAENHALKQAEEERQKKLLSAELDKAIKDGRLDHSGRESVLAMPHQQAMALLEALPKRTPISEQIQSTEAELSQYDKLSWEQLDKGNHLAHLKAEHPSYYAERFKKQFGKKPR